MGAESNVAKVVKRIGLTALRIEFWAFPEETDVSYANMHKIWLVNALTFSVLLCVNNNQSGQLRY